MGGAGKRRIVIEPRESLRHFGGGDLVGIGDPAAWIGTEGRNAARKPGQRAARMGEEQVEAPIAPKDAGIKHVDHGARRIKRRLDESTGTPQARTAVTPCGGMEKQRRLQPVKLGPNRLETRIAEIDAVEIAEDRKAFGAELVIGTAYLVDGASGLGHRQPREKTETPRIGPYERGAVTVRRNDRIAIRNRIAVR